MTGSNDATPVLRDRSLGLIIFGAISVLVGGGCALMVPLGIAATALSSPVGGAGVDTRSALSVSALYAVMAVVFVWLGVGSIRARRWARELLLSLSWIWLLTGACSLVIGVFVIPAVVRSTAGSSGLPPEMTTILLLVVFASIGFLYVVLPMSFVLFYRSPHVAATCRRRDPRPQWIDRCPRRLLTLTVVWFLAAVSVLLMPAYNFFLPLFGVVLTGVAGAVGWSLVLAACVALALGTCRRAPWAWWSGVVVILAAALSSVLTVVRYDLGEILALMALPAGQVEMMSALGMTDGWSMVVFNVVVWGTFLAYLISVRSYFAPAPVTVDE
jgi:hypothetical protein